MIIWYQYPFFWISHHGYIPPHLISVYAIHNSSKENLNACMALWFRILTAGYHSTLSFTYINRINWLWNCSLHSRSWPATSCYRGCSTPRGLNCSLSSSIERSSFKSWICAGCHLILLDPDYRGVDGPQSKLPMDSSWYLPSFVSSWKIKSRVLIVLGFVLGIVWICSSVLTPGAKAKALGSKCLTRMCNACVIDVHSPR